MRSYGQDCATKRREPLTLLLMVDCGTACHGTLSGRPPPTQTLAYLSNALARLTPLPICEVIRPDSERMSSRVIVSLPGAGASCDLYFSHARRDSGE